MQVKSVIEFGCGDGNQLRFANYPSYLGFDISPEAILRCQELFKDDDTKSFKLLEEYNGEKADLTLSLDVIYHLVEDTVFDKYMNQLFDTATKYVLIYSSNTDKQEKLQPAHVKHRIFSKWIETNKAGWILDKHIPNAYSYATDKINGSVADIFIYKLHK
jgi:cyclopropane fatty-acyl-phospholipid synthase-like methyltransferase